MAAQLFRRILQAGLLRQADVHTLPQAAGSQRERHAKGHVDVGIEALRIPHWQAGQLQRPGHAAGQVQVGNILGRAGLLKPNPHCFNVPQHKFPP